MFFNLILLASEAITTSKQPQWPNQATGSNSLISITLISMCILPLTSNFETSEAMVIVP